MPFNTNAWNEKGDIMIYMLSRIGSRYIVLGTQCPPKHYLQTDINKNTVLMTGLVKRLVMYLAFVFEEGICIVREIKLISKYY